MTAPFPPDSFGPPPAATPKASWPLIALGATAFVPGLGFIFGAVAVSWALLSERPRRTLALGLGATGAFLNLAGGFWLGFSHRHDPGMQTARSRITQHDLVQVVLSLERYRAAYGSYPPTLNVLVGAPIPTTLLNIYDHSDGSLTPRFYRYTISADGQSYDLFAVGPDGLPATTDDITPPIPDSLRSQTGYAPAH